MISCDRQPNYAEDSVRHFRAGSDMPLVVFVDGDDDTYLGKHDGVITVVEPVARGNDVGSWRAYDRCRLNTVRAVKSTPEGADLLLLEDDIALRRDWEKMLRRALDVCHDRFGADFVLSLYSATKPGRREGPLAGYHYRDYYGNIAVVLSSGAVAKFLDVASQTTVPSDMIVKEMLWKTRIPLRQTSPNMAQHLGDVSTTGTHRIIRSASFRGGFAGGVRNYRPKPPPAPPPAPVKVPPPKPKPKPKPRPKYKDKVHICMATLPDREPSFARALGSLREQADAFHIYLNGHQRVPSFLRGDKGSDCDIWRSKQNDGAVMKFWWANQLSGYLLYCDDDIIYPPNYVERVVEGIERYGRRAVVGFHGSVFPDDFSSYAKDRGKGCSFVHLLKQDMPVHILGTGVMGYHSSTPSALAEHPGEHFRVSMADFPYPNMLDIWFGIACQDHEVPMVCLAKPGGIFGVLPQQHSIHDDVLRDDSKYTDSVMIAWPWNLHEAKRKSS